MGTDDVFTRKDKKLGTGINDDFYMEHDGTDSKLVNDTGHTYIHTTQATKKTIIDNSSNDNDFVVDHDNDRIGIGTSAPSYYVHLLVSGANAEIVAERSGVTVAYMGGGTTYGFFGTKTNNATRLTVNGSYKFEITTNGDMRCLAAFATVIGGTNIDTYTDNTGLFGPLPSSIIFKENIRDLTDEDTSWIYNIPVKMCDYKDGTKDQITVIAEEAEPIRSGVIRYAPFEITAAGPILINRSEYKGIEKIHEKIKPGEEKEIELDKISIDKNGDETIEKITKRVKLQPFTTNKSDFIYPLVKELQKKNLVIENLLTRVNALELKAGIASVIIPESNIKKKPFFSRKQKK
jgi:hypothetical protein